MVKPANNVESAMLAATEMQWIYNGCGELTFLPNIYTLQHGIFGTWGDPERIGYNPDDALNQWNTYTGGLGNAHFIYSEATKNKKDNLIGIAEIIMAFYYAEIVDRVNDSPLTEAFQYLQGIVYPKYDKGEDIYNQILTWLDDAAQKLSKDNAEIQPKNVDLIFGGDVSKWLKVAYTLKARYAMRLSYFKGKTAMADVALAALQNGIQDASDEPKITFLEGNDKHSYFYEVNFVSPWRPTIFIMNLMQSLNDPRIPIYFVPGIDGVYRCVKSCVSAGDADSLAVINMDYVAATSSMYATTVAETKFIEAEAWLFKGDYTKAEAAFKAAIASNMGELGVAASDINTYIAQFTFPNTEEAAQEMIITQKYLALFCKTSEPWNDYLRTGYPHFDWAGSIDQPINSHVSPFFLFIHIVS